MNANITQETWSKNVILVDADYVDRVAFDLTVNFERMLERRIPQADLARWIDCVALDGGLRSNKPQTDDQADGQTDTTGQPAESVQVILLHDKDKKRLENFAPAHYENELDGQAFSDSLGEFLLSAVAVEELTTKEALFCESLQFIGSQQDVRRIMVVADERYYDRVRQTLNRLDDDSGKRITVFSMQPLQGGQFRQEILGFSLMAALGIRGEEVTNKQNQR